MINVMFLKSSDSVSIALARKPLSIEFIRKKLDGKMLKAKEIDQIVWDIVNNKLSDIELTYFVVQRHRLAALRPYYCQLDR